MNLIKDDILKDINPNMTTIILHGANCQHVMGGGIAKYLRDKFPIIYHIDCKTRLSDPDKLGTFSVAHVKENLTIFNCYTQFNYDSRQRQVDYEAVYQCLEGVHKLLLINQQPIEVRSPQIGCGLAGGSWTIIEAMFDELLPDANIYYI